MAGMDVHRFLTTTDPLEGRLMQLVAERRARFEEQRDDNLAVRIRNEIGDLLSS